MGLKGEEFKIKLKDTRDRRKSMDCKTFEVKFDKSKFSTEKKNYLNRLFLEAKWIYNSILGHADPFKYNTKIKTVEVLNKDREWEERELEAISSQMKQSIGRRTVDSIVGLSRKKKKGGKIGRLKFKSEINSIPLVQNNVTYKINNDKYIKLQGFKKPFKVKGLHQIPEGAELANANLVRKAGDLYLKITCFVPKKEKVKTGNMIGLDFGIKDNVITSDGDKFNFCFPETNAIKKSSKKLSRCKKGSRRRFKAKIKRQKTYNKLSNQKKDVKNKFVSKLVKENDIIAIQDESIHEWHQNKLCGKKVQHSIMGGIILGLKQHPETLIVVDKYFPSTQLCPKCERKNKHTLDQRIYSCECGYSCDRDIHASRNILNEGIKQLGTERIKTLLTEQTTSGKQPCVDSKVDCDDVRSLYALA